MKKVLLILPIILALTTGCTLYKPVSTGIQPPVISPTTPTAPTTPSPSPVSPQAKPPTPPPNADNTVSVAELNRNKDSYAGKTVRVKGKIEVSVSHLLIPCPGTEQCDNTRSGGVFLWESPTIAGAENSLAVYKNAKTYPCMKVDYEKYDCPPFTDGEITTIEGVWVKERVPSGWSGTSGGAPPTPISWTDRYYLNVT